MDRQYSVEEIERMRAALSRVFRHEVAEDQLRTYMMAGVEPRDLERRLEQLAQR